MEDEYRRLAALRAYEVLDTPPDPVLDQITELTSCVFEAPLACVSLVDSHRLFLKAAHGVDARELGKEPGMCVTTVETNTPRQVADLLSDPIACQHPLVAGAPHYRFYAGTPLRSRDGYAIGTLCIFDEHTRELNEMEMGCLDILGHLVMERLEHHRREAERAAQAKALDRYGPFVRLGANLAPVGVLELDVTGTVVRISASGRDVTGLAVGDHLSDMPLRDEADRTRLKDLVQRRHGEVSPGGTFGLSYTAASGSTMLLQAEAEHDPDGSVRGITATVRELSGIAELGEQVLEAQKLESLGALAGGIAHDFNNVLAAIMGHTSLASKAGAGIQDVQRHLASIDTATERASNLCDQLLAYSGGGLFTVSSFDLSELVADMRELLEVSMSKKTSIGLRLHAAPAVVEGNPTQIRQVIMNVLMNASEAIGDGPGSVTVSTSVRELSGDELHAMYFGDALEPGGYVCLEVTDDGEGMDPEVGARIFDPLFSTKHGGHGLGMAAVGGILRAHRGAIEIETEPGTGTTVRVLLPVGTGASEPASSGPLPAERNTPRSGTVLVVEDEAALRQILEETLVDAGYTALCAADGADAIRAIDRAGPGIDAAIIDMMLPNVDGAELYNHIVEARPRTKVILTSGYNEREATRRITDSGQARFIKKPYRPDELVTLLDELLEPPAPKGRVRRLLRSPGR